MTRKIKNIIKGMGSVLEIVSDTNYQALYSIDMELRLKRPWERTGMYIRRAMERFSSEQKKEK